MNLHVPYTQSGRLMAVKTVLGEDALLLERLEVEEGLSQLFTIRATVRAQREEVKPDEIVGTSADLALTLSDGTQRVWNGLVTELHEGPIVTRGARQYALTLRPRLWLMSQRSDCRIFLNQTTLQVVETLCSEHGIKDFDLAGVTTPPAKQDYAVQWNETDLAYLLRRLEEDGKFYWFEHARGKHVFTVGDHPSSYRDSAEQQVRIAFGSADAEHIHDWRRQLSFTPGRRAGGDWEFTTPNTTLQSTTPSLVKLPGNVDYELYEYPARALSREAGDAASRLRVQATEADFDRIQGRSSVRTLAAGHRFRPYEVAHPDHAYDPQVVTAILHRAEDPTYETGAGTPHYENEFAVMPASRPATPHRTTPRPRIDGLQIARIAGPEGEEIHTDPFGRVKLTFPWDRRAKSDGSDTGWVRVSQSWGGGTWGQQIIPRIGMEALVAYQEGDPDRPIVVGIVPNPNTPVPYKLPDHKTRMTLRSNSHKAKGFNEMSLEDEGGQENMFFHAQKDHTTRVLNNQTQRTDANHTASVGANQALEVAKNQTQEIGGSMNLTVGGTGAAATALMAPLAGMAGHTAGLLSQAAQVAGLGGIAGDAIGMMATGLASSALGMLGGSGLQARDGVVSGPNPRADAGTALSQAGGSLGQAAGGLFSLPGMMNTLVGSMKFDSVGMARVEQIGSSKITHVGATFLTQVGNYYKVAVGDEFVIEVGASKFVMKKDGTVLILGKKFNFIADDHVQIRGAPIDLN